MVLRGMLWCGVAWYCYGMQCEDPDPHPDPHQSGKLDKRVPQIWRRIRIWIGIKLKARLWIRIGIRVKGRLRIRIRIKEKNSAARQRDADPQHYWYGTAVQDRTRHEMSTSRM
jgi:hypothetical protein